MKISWNWLNSLVPLENVTTEQLAEKLTVAGLEVDSIKQVNSLGNSKNDIILDVISTANRSDALSLIGIAREVSVLFQQNFEFSKVEIATWSLSSKHEKKFDQFINVSCLVTCLEISKKINVPSWIQERLSVSGIMLHNNINDILNYVMLETGFPLHSLDIEKLSHEAIDYDHFSIAENTVNDAPFIDATNKQHIVDSKAVPILYYKNKKISICGIFNNTDFIVDNTSSKVLLYSLLVPPTVARRTTKLLVANNDISQRLERGLTPQQMEYAYKRALYLLKFAGIDFSSTQSISSFCLSDNIVTVNISRVHKILGIACRDELDSKKISNILSCLGFQVDIVSDNLIIKVPNFRYYDVVREIDIIEEIARIYGFDKFVASLPNFKRLGRITSRESLVRKIRLCLKDSGLSEVLNYSLENLSVHQNKNVDILITNPLNIEYIRLRQTLLNGILSTLSYNVKNNNNLLNVYEIGRVFSKQESYQEQYFCSGIMGQQSLNGYWKIGSLEGDWFFYKGILENLLFGIGSNITWHKISFEKNCVYSDLFHKYKVCQICIDNQNVGYYGQIHPKIHKNLAVNSLLYGFELNLEALLNIYNVKLNQKEVFSEYSVYPSVSRDISLVVPYDISFEEIQNKILSLGQSFLWKSFLIDIYEGDPIKKGYRSLTFRLLYRVQDRTLTLEEVDQVHQHLYTTLSDLF
uniref:phenylalanyl-tRNA synthetase beta subunit n=1 Tax=Erythrolobus coxiae TaxID=362235 RepID=UPI001FCD8A64|nr:phenylalanyl-tRNA synthetase beta subunit [Erythrolobus coxiae]UNJ17758.1 phenylalanyl-tRNA synthetase beta subunit [Erythrolobus coxiae]